MSGRVIIGAPSSGSGKTTVVCAVLRALAKRGLKVTSAKCGPDYIDPMFHRTALGIPSVNIDSFFSDRDTLRDILARHGNGSDITVCEGVMGLYDGLSMENARASTYETAVLTDTPVVLVVPCRGMAYTAAAYIKGIVEFQKERMIKGIIMNNVTEMTYKTLAPVIERETGVEVIGYMSRLDENVLKSRHLGLVMPSEIDGISEQLDYLAECAEKTINLDRLLDIANSAPKLEFAPRRTPKSDIKIAVARDEAFCFYYKENIDILTDMGAEIAYFSPLHDEKLPDGVCGMIIGGGYPELYAQQLSQNSKMLHAVRNAIEDGMPTIAECGGFMYLHRETENDRGESFPMVGVIDAKAFKTNKLVRFGYITLTSNEDTSVLEKGQSIRAHEFHYWDSTDCGTSCRAQKPSGKRGWDCVVSRKSLFAGYPHLYFPSNTAAARRFCDMCRNYNDKRYGKIYMVTGASGSGKSEFAENTAVRLKNELCADNLVYLAAMKPFGEEGQRRIARHRQLREGKGFSLIERYTSLETLTVPEKSVVLVECVSNLAANEMFDENGAHGRVCEAVVGGILHIAEQARAVVVVTNEVFSDGCDYDDTTKEYIRKLGEINVTLARYAREVHTVIAGIEVRLK